MKKVFNFALYDFANSAFTTIIMISAVKSINKNFEYNINTNTLEKLAENNQYNFLISSFLKGCGFKNINSLYECKYYKPLISINLIN